MNISRFFGATNREALRQVRLALGPEALIVSNRRVNGGVEILATDQTGAVQEQHGQATTPMASTQAGGVPQAASSSADEVLLTAIGDVRGALEARIDELVWGGQLRRAPQAVDLFQSLLGCGFSTALLRAMLTRLPGHLTGRAAFQWARNELVENLPILASEQDFWQPGMAIALVGPTGSGKTTSVAKLAARCVQRFGPENVVLLTTDTYRIGAYEQLRQYGQLMQTPVHLVQDAHELAARVADLTPQQVVLIDNTGISQRDGYVAEQAALLARSPRRVTRLLVLNASSHGDTLDEVARSYANDGGTPLAGCIITKVDEASRLGMALDTSIRYQLPIHWVSAGQKVPTDLQHQAAQTLVDRSLAHGHGAQGLYAPTRADLAALIPANEAVKSTTPPASPGTRARMAPSLLAMMGHAGGSLIPADLEHACRYVDESLACSTAYSLWRSHCAGERRPARSAERGPQLFMAALSECSRSGQKLMLAMHDSASLVGGRSGKFSATVLGGEDGVVLTSPYQQVAQPEGWFDSAGQSEPRSPAAVQALRRQIAWVQEARVGLLPVVHLFDKGNGGLWAELSEAGLPWLSPCAGTTGVVHDLGRITVAAVAKSMSWLPLDRLPGVDPQTLTCWVGEATVMLAARGRRQTFARLICLRLVRRDSGKVFRTIYGLTDLGAARVPIASLAVWLLLRVDLPAAFRYAACQWSNLSKAQGLGGLETSAAGQWGADLGGLDLLAPAMQCGVAAWSMMRDEAADDTRRILRALAHGAPLTTPRTASFLLRLFALKSMMESA